MDAKELLAQLSEGKLDVAGLGLALASESERPALLRCVLPRRFDRALFEEVLAGDPPALRFERLVANPSIERVPGAGEWFRVRSGDRQAWLAAWRDRPPGELQAVSRALMDSAAAREPAAAPVEQLFHAVAVAPGRALRLLIEAFDEADRAFELLRAADLLAAVAQAGSEGELVAGQANRLVALVGYAETSLHAAYEDRRRRLAARTLFEDDYYRSSVYYDRLAVRKETERFLANGKRWLLPIHAPGGSGKTIFLRWLISRRLLAATPEHIPCARIDFDFIDRERAARQPWFLLTSLAEQLAPQVPSGELGALVRWVRSHELVLAKEAHDPAAAHARGARLEREVPARFAAALNEMVRQERRVVLVLDTIEEPLLHHQGTDLVAVLRSLVTVRGTFRGLKVMLSGRYTLAETRGAQIARELGENQGEILEIAPFSPDERTGYLASRGLGEHPAAARVAELSNGSPFELGLWAELLAAEPGLDPDRIGPSRDPRVVRLVRRVLLRLPDARVRWLLRYGVVARQRLTLDLVRGVLAPSLSAAMAGRSPDDDPGADPIDDAVKGDLFPTGMAAEGEALDVEALWAALRGYASDSAWVSRESGREDTLVLHPEVTEPMRVILRARDPLYRRLHREARTYFAAEAARDPATWAERTAEAVYHAFQAEGPVAEGEWRAVLEAARGRGPEAHERVAAEVLGPEYVDENGAPRAWGEGRPIIRAEAVVRARLEVARALAARAALDGDDAAPLWRKVSEALAVARAAMAGAEGSNAGWEDVAADEIFLLETEALVHTGRVKEAAGAFSKVAAALQFDVRFLGWNARVWGAVRAAEHDPEAIALAERAEQLLPSLGGQRTLIERYGDFDRLSQAVARAGAAGDFESGDPRRRARALDLVLRSGRYDDLPPAGSSPEAALAAEQAELDSGRLAAWAPPEAEAPASASGGAEWVAVRRAELDGQRAEATLELETALACYDRARAGWNARSEVEAGLRCLRRCIELELHVAGRFRAARALIAETASVTVSHAFEEVALIGALEVELLARTEGRGAAAERWRKLEMAFAGDRRPRIAARVALAGLVQAPGDPAIARRLIAALAEVTPLEARLVLARGGSYVPTSQEPAVPLGEILALLPEPAALEQAPALAIAAVDLLRLLGHAGAAAERFASIPHEGTDLGFRDLLRAGDRLGQYADMAEVAAPRLEAFAERHAHAQRLGAVVLIEQATRLLHAGDVKGAIEMLQLVQPGPPKYALTAWEAQHQWLWTKLGARAGTDVTWQYARHVGLLREIANEIGDPSLMMELPEAAATERDSGASAVVVLGLAEEGTIVARVTAPGVAGIETTRRARLGVELAAAERDETPYWLVQALAEDRAAFADDLGTYLLPYDVATNIRRPEIAGVDLRLEMTDPRLFAVPWELALPSGGGQLIGGDGFRRMYRSTPPGAQPALVAWAQGILQAELGRRVFPDGILGVDTAGAIRDLQARVGLSPTGHLDVATIEALAGLADRLRDHAAMAAVVVGKNFDARHAYGMLGMRSTPVDDTGGLLKFLTAPEPNIAVLHLYCEFGESPRSDAAGVHVLLPDGGGVTANHLARAIARGPGPIVVLDPPWQASASETARQLLLRNRFAGELFATGRIRSVLGAGFIPDGAFKQGVTRGIANDRGLAATCDLLRALPRSDTDGLPAFAASIPALFTYSPAIGVSQARVAP